MRVSPPPAYVDTPRSAYGVLERRATLATTAGLLTLAGLAWWSTVRTAGDMSAMTLGLADVGAAMPFAMSAPVFVAMWTTMMVAMMFPTIAPIVLLHRMVVRRRGQGAGPTLAFAGGYLGVWTAVGLVPLTVLLLFRAVAHDAAWAPRAGGAVLVVAGLYQFSRWKDTCQRACRTPLTFLATHDFGSGWRGALRTGAAHGLFCLGCCWALMAVLFVVGLMNLVWMAAIAVVFLAEKHLRHGRALAMVVGASVTLVGVAVLVEPALLADLAGLPDAHPGMTMDGG
jgi:predicted metal-binding membrane protein